MAWNGLDTGGVEHLWEDSRLLAVLEVLNRHQPFAYGDIESPIFDDLKEFDPNTTWIDTDKNEGVRSIFRRANPLMKLGLISGNAQSANLTQTGLDILQRDMSLSSLYQAVARGFVDLGGSRSFADMARAVILFPNHEFTIPDIEFAVAISNGTKADLSDRLNQLRQNSVRFPTNSRRPRILQRFLKTLVSANVLVETQVGWKLASEKAAKFVMGANHAPDAQTFAEIDAMAQPSITRNKSAFSVVEIAKGKRPIPSFGANAFTQMDNSQRALLLERAHDAHEALVELCADDVRKSGGTPIEGSDSFDVGCFDKFKLLIEAKYVNSRNVISQLRKATAQLPEYQWRHQTDLGPDAKQIIAVSENPIPLAGTDYLKYVREDRKLEIIWQSSSGLINPDGQSLPEILALL
jgi:hypothetical protein